MSENEYRYKEVLRPAAKSVEDVANVGLVSRAYEVSNIVDNDDRCTLGCEVFLDVLEHASAIELGI